MGRWRRRTAPFSLGRAKGRPYGSAARQDTKVNAYSERPSLVVVRVSSWVSISRLSFPHPDLPVTPSTHAGEGVERLGVRSLRMKGGHLPAEGDQTVAPTPARPARQPEG